MDESFNLVLDEEFGEFENARSRNISKNFEFMKACGECDILFLLSFFKCLASYLFVFHM